MNREKHEERLKFIQENWSTKNSPPALRQMERREFNLINLILFLIAYILDDKSQHQARATHAKNTGRYYHSRQSVCIVVSNFAIGFYRIGVQCKKKNAQYNTKAHAHEQTTYFKRGERGWQRSAVAFEQIVQRGG